MHPNSLAAHSEATLDGTFSQREIEIIWALRAHNEPLTDRNLMHICCYSDMNQIRPRVTELIAKGILEEVGSTKDQITGKTVRLVKLAPRQGKLFL